jgi:hypothetical protein
VLSDDDSDDLLAAAQAAARPPCAAAALAVAADDQVHGADGSTQQRHAVDVTDLTRDSPDEEPRPLRSRLAGMRGTATAGSTSLPLPPAAHHQQQHCPEVGARAGSSSQVAGTGALLGAQAGPGAAGSDEEEDDFQQHSSARGSRLTAARAAAALTSAPGSRRVVAGLRVRRQHARGSA